MTGAASPAVTGHRSPGAEPIAITGLGCRLPGGIEDPAQCWNFLISGGDGVREIPPERFDIESWFDPVPGRAGRIYCRHLGALDDVMHFDHALFGISAREAATMDPQHRLLLEVAWHALEDAGENPRQLSGSRTGVFVGTFSDDYTQRGVLRQDPGTIDGYAALGVLRGLAAGRVSYHLDLRGPALTIDTACSSALVAAHLAVQSLRAGECDMAVAGGVNLVLSPEITLALCQLRALSLSGRCRAFSAGADGYVRGEGCGLLVLKRLSDALADGSRIVAIIHGSAVNHDGRSNGIAAPNPAAQQAVIRAALADAGVAPQMIGYVEAHGTGTPLGDPIELRALKQALQSGADHQVLVGSAKTNFGHLESAAGAAGLMKLALALEHGTIPPSLHFDEPNPHIDWGQIGISVVDDPRAWPAAGFGGVSAFGMSGTNAHMILGPPPVPPPRPATEFQVLALSARSEPAFQLSAASLADRLEAPDAPAVADVCHTLNAARPAWGVRAGFVARDMATLAQDLRRARPHVVRQDPRVVLLFGSTDIVPLELLAAEPVLREALEALAPAAQAGTGRSLEDELKAGQDHDPFGRAVLVLALQLAVTHVLRGWAVRPQVVAGLGAGEIAAACAADVMDPEAAFALLAAGAAHPDEEPALLRPVFRKLLQGALHAPQARVISGMLGRAVEAELLSPAFWADQARRSPVGITDAVAAGAANRAIALGPIGSVTGATDVFASGAAGLAECLARLHEAGAAPDWRAVGQLRGGRRISLPGSRFEQSPHDRLGPVPAPCRHRPGDGLAGSALDLPASSEIRREVRLDAPGLRFLHDHRIDGRAVLAAAGVIEIFLAAATSAGMPPSLSHVRFDQPVWLDQPDGPVLHSVIPADGKAALYCRSGAGTWTRHASAQLATGREIAEQEPAPSLAARMRGEGTDMPDIPAVLRQSGVEHGPGFRALQRLVVGDGRAWGEVTRESGEDGSFHADPRMLDACLHVASPLLGAAPEGMRWLPVGVGHLSIPSALPERLCCEARLVATDGRTATVDYSLSDHAGAAAGRLLGVEIRAVAGGVHRAPTPARFYQLKWAEASPDPAAPGPRRWIVMLPGRAADALAAELRRAGQDAAVAAEPDWHGGARVVCLAYPQGSEEPPGADALPVLRAAAANGGELVLVTRGAQAVLAGDPPAEPRQAAYWGLGRVLARECPRLPVRLLDLGPETNAAALAAQLVAQPLPAEAAIRGETRFHPRLESESSAERPARVAIPEGRAGSPGPGEVRIDVVASGLNFRDVLHARALLPETASVLPFGLECSGIVRAVGNGVTRFAPGDAVMAGVAAGSLGGQVTLPESFVVPIPAAVGFRAAAALPIAWLTASYAFEHLARLHAGQRVLIHAAAGGVGQAAVALAQALGAEVLATASRWKWPALRRQGVRHLFSSRDTTFPPQVRAATGGNGVDVVLHSLGADFVTPGLDCLAPGGCFVEIGKLGAWSPQAVQARRPDIRYEQFDLLDLRKNQPLIASMLGRLQEGLAAGTVTPPRIETFPLSECDAAFDHMAHASHIGKIVLWHGRPSSTPVMPDATYLVTGGLGGLGLITARWLVERGARFLVLAGRRPPTAAAMQALDPLRRTGAGIACITADVAQREEVAALLARIDRAGPPLRGIVHAAGQLDDAALPNQTAERLERVMAGKLRGAQHLDELTRARPLDFFWLYSSLAGLLGNPGQANYAAANAALDAVALRRAALGLPALSIDWGPWTGTGMAARIDAAAGAAAPLDPDAAGAVLDRLLVFPGAQVAVTGAGGLDAARFGPGRTPPLLQPAAAGAPDSGISLRYRINDALPSDRRPLLFRRVRAIAAAALRIQPEQLDPEQELAASGFDSLVNIEVRAELEEQLALTLSPSFGFDHPTITAMVDHLLERLAPAAQTDPASEPPSSAGEPDPAAALISELEGLKI